MVNNNLGKLALLGIGAYALMRGGIGQTAPPTMPTPQPPTTPTPPPSTPTPPPSTPTPPPTPPNQQPNTPPDVLQENFNVEALTTYTTVQFRRQVRQYEPPYHYAVFVGGGKIKIGGFVYDSGGSQLFNVNSMLIVRSEQGSKIEYLTTAQIDKKQYVLAQGQLLECVRR